MHGRKGCGTANFAATVSCPCLPHSLAFRIPPSNFFFNHRLAIRRAFGKKRREFFPLTLLLSLLSRKLSFFFLLVFPPPSSPSTSPLSPLPLRRSGHLLIFFSLLLQVEPLARLRRGCFVRASSSSCFYSAFLLLFLLPPLRLSLFLGVGVEGYYYNRVVVPTPCFFPPSSSVAPTDPRTQTPPSVRLF